MNKKTLAWAACLVFSLVSGMPMAQAQSAYAPPPAAYTQEQLDQILAPVALYPDSLLAQVLMAATYPLEVVQAQRFVDARPGLQGDGLARAVAPMPWDPSVKALVQFPSVLAMMNDRLDWTQQLGQAFLSQQAPVMDTVQDLRDRAQVAGTLQSNPQQRVLADDGLIVIEPINPQVVYVPYYNPVVVYGNWWWPSAPPMVWTPPPRYRPPHYSPGVTASISFSSGIGVMRATFGDARPDWRQRQMMVTQTRITNVTNNHVTNNVTINRNVTVNQRPVVWHHDSRFGGPRPQPGQNPQHADGRPDTPRGGPAQQAQPARPAAQFAAQAPQAAQQPRPAPVPPNAQQQRIARQDQERQREVHDQQQAQVREAQGQQRQREQQAHEQQRQREQVANDQQRQREQMARDQRQQQQAQERNVQQRQQQEQARQHQDQARQQQEQARREQQARPPRNERRDEHRDDGK